MNHLFRKVLCFLAGVFICYGAEAAIHLTKLQVQSLDHPAGIDTPAPYFSWQWTTDKRNSTQGAYQILVATSKDRLRKGQGDVWNSGKIESDRQRYIKLGAGALKSGKTYYWKVKIWDNNGNESSWSNIASFTTGILQPAEWVAEWITYDTAVATSMPVFRKHFVLKKNIASAVVHISGLGYYELYFNGNKAGDHVLDPGQTNYDDYALYVTYDVTNLLRKGGNVVGVMLGDGWYNQNKVWGKQGLSYGIPLVICQLNVTYTDGTSEQVISDRSWQWRNGPVLSSNVYAGETYDARKEIAGWNTIQMEDRRGWTEVSLAQTFPPKLVAQCLPPIKRMAELKARKVYKVAEGTYMFDFGQNFSGWTRLKVSAPAGTTFTIRTAEEVHADGTLNPASTGVFATKVVQTEKYICKGDGVEIWEPRFTYHGFRYAEVSGLHEAPSEDFLTGIVVYSSVKEVGNFSCSDDQMNKLHKLAQWTLVGNLHSIPTDCPAREKCGWLGDAHAMAPMSIYNYDMENFYIKYLYDIRSSSREQKQTLFYKSWNNLERRVKPAGIPYMIAPGKREAGTASPDWGTAVVQLPWYLYLYYGNKEILREFYPDMKNWVSYIEGLSVNHIVHYGLGDWCPPGRIVPLNPPVSLTSTAFYYLDLKIMNHVAAALGFKKDEDDYLHKMAVVKQVFLDSFYNKQQKTFGGQTADALALDLGIAPSGDEKAVSNNIAKLSKDSLDGFLNTGIFGLGRIFGALSDNGNEKTAFSILTKKGYNSFDYMWSQYDATTLWEILPVDSFYIKGSDEGTERSHNHPMQGSYDKWFYESVVGIRPVVNTPGFKKIVIDPGMTDELQWAKGTYYSGFGEIQSDWENKNGIFYWKVTIPAGTEATLHFPTMSVDNITEDENSILKIKGLQVSNDGQGKVACRIGSGSYSFKVVKD